MDEWKARARFWDGVLNKSVFLVGTALLCGGAGYAIFGTIVASAILVGMTWSVLSLVWVGR